MTAMELVSHFNMSPHPEGGFFTETYRSAGTIARSALPQEYSGDRSFSTAILFLLRQGEYSHLHRIRQDEVWHFHMGGPLRLVTLSPEGSEREILLGTDLIRGHEVQAVVPCGSWFGATPDTWPRSAGRGAVRELVWRNTRAGSGLCACWLHGGTGI